MRRSPVSFPVAALAALVAFAAAPAGCPAHPMGNLSINHYAGLEIGPDSVRVKYLLDFAEIPAIAELDLVDPDHDERVTPEEREAYLARRTEEVLAALRLEVNGRSLTLEPLWSRVAFPPGEAGLSTVRIAWDLRAGLASETLEPSNFLVWNDTNFAGRVGWKEIRISAADGVALGRTSLRESPASGELAEYPEEYLYDPPTDTKAWCLFGVGVTEEDLADLEPPPEFAPRQPPGKFTSLIAAEDLGPGVILASLLLALVLGAGHALEPGHGKTVVAAYLVGSRGTVLQAVLLGLTVTLTHTFSVFLLGLAALTLSRHFVPERVFPLLGVVSGALITIVGLVMLRARLRERRASRHPHGHDHDHAHGHSHVPPERASLGSILLLGVSGGLVPCPAGIVVLLSAVALGRIVFGLCLITAFSLGLAIVLVAIGILFVKAGNLFARFSATTRIVRELGVLSASVITVFGLILAVRALLELGALSGP